MNHFYKKMGQETALNWSAKTWLERALFMCLFLAASVVSAQSVTVSGKITDSSDGSGLPGVTIQEKGTSNGTTTDFDGNFQLTVSSSSATLVISSVGFTTQELVVGNQTSINISMSEDVQALGEIVVIGYGTVKKSDLTGSVTSINSDKFNKGTMTSPQDLIVGRMPGVSVISDGGAPGTGSTIRIRGGSSLSASNNPLFVIDGMVISDEGISGSRNPLNTINPNDIENVTVLKDASATAIYGARASNGVIIVTTKRGKAGQPLTLSYDAQFSYSVIPKTVDVLSSEEYRNYIDQGVTDGKLAATVPELLGDANTDWQDQIYREAFSMNHNIGLTGAIKNTPSFIESLPYRVSLGYTNQEGILKGTDFQRINTSLGLDPSFLNGDLQVQLNVKYSTAQNNFGDEGAIGSAVAFDPTQPIYDENSPWGGYYYWEGNDAGVPNSNAPSNPVSLINLRNNESTVNRFIGNVRATYKLPWIEGLSATVNLAKDKSVSAGTDVVSSESAWTRILRDNVVYTGRDNAYSALTENDLIEAYGTYSKELPSLDSKLEVLGGYSWQHFYRKSYFETYDASRFIELAQPDTSSSENYLISFYGRLNYTFKEKYLFTFTLRNDGSSRFANGNQWGLFPSAAFAWRAKDENFLSNVEIISDLKFRIGYGVTGQENVGSAYPAIARVSTGNTQAQYAFGQDVVTIARFDGYDPNLKWEQTTTYNAGVDFGVWENRITGSVDYFQKETKDLLNDIPIPRGTNFSNRLLTNVGSMEIKGIEVALNAILVDQGDLRVDFGYNITSNQIKITQLTVVDDPDFKGVLTGGIAGGVGNDIQIHAVGHPRNAYYTYEQVYDTNGDPIEGVYIDQNEDGIINPEDRVITDKRPDPKYFMGFNSNMKYKNWNFGFNARMNVGNYNYNNINSRGYYDNAAYSIGGGYTNNVIRNANTTGFESPQFLSNYYLENATFFRMDNITVGYRFNQLFTERVAASINFTVQNAFVITKYSGLDPEVSGGIDNNLYPRPRVFVLGLNINFK